ncbi:tRNA adenosine deaminase-associated protein [Streptomyces aculeolatus]
MYFAALLARTEDGWEASDTELDDVETLDDLADLAREATADADETVLVLLEQEDIWYSVIRIDGEDDPRVFVSNAAAAGRSAYGEILLTPELLGREPEDDSALDSLTDLDGTEDGEPDADTGADADSDADPDAPPGTPAGPVGDSELLEDLGVSEKQLLALNGDAVNEIADLLGAADVLETVR